MHLSEVASKLVDLNNFLSYLNLIRTIIPFRFAGIICNLSPTAIFCCYKKKFMVLTTTKDCLFRTADICSSREPAETCQFYGQFIVGRAL